MSLNHTATYGRSKPQAGSLIRCWTFVIGFNDATAARSFDPRWETWPEREQRYYENGRLIAANILLAGEAPRLMPSNTKRKPQWYIEAMERAKAVVGDVRPLPVVQPKHESEVYALLAPAVRIRTRYGKRVWLPGAVPTTLRA